MCLGFALGNYVYLIKSVHELTGLSESFSSFMVYILVAIMLMIIVEPEKMKPVAYVLSAFVLGSATLLMIANYWRYHSFGPIEGREYNYWKMKDSGLLIGVSLFAFESISSIITIRRTSKFPKQMKRFSIVTFTSCAIYFIIFALFGNTTLKKIGFDYYEFHTVIHKLKYFVAFNPFFSLTFNSISIVEVLEGFKFFNPILRKSNGELNGKKILLTRLSLLTILFICTLLSTNIAVIFDLVGAVFGPIVGLLVPVVLYEAYFKETGRFVSFKLKFFHRFMLVCAVIFLCSGIYSSFTSD